MNYLSTRDKSLKFSLRYIFKRPCAWSGLFLPAEIISYNKNDLSKLSKLIYKTCDRNNSLFL